MTQHSFTGGRALLLNEVFHEVKRCIFIAIPKTAKTSIRNQLKQEGDFWIPNPQLSILQIRDCSYSYYLRKNLGKKRAFLTQSIATDLAIREHARESFATIFRFSMVRNPWVRFVSLCFRKEGVCARSKNDHFTAF